MVRGLYHPSGLLRMVLCLLAAACVSGASIAVAAPTIPPSALVIRARDFPGFAHARAKVTVATTPREWAAFLKDPKPEAEAEIKENTDEGFQDAVYETFSLSSQLAIYEVQVFTSRAGARHLLGQQVSTESTAARGEPGLAMSRLPGFPGSVVISTFSVRAHEVSTSVLVTTGRCMLKVADALSHVSTRAQSKRAAFAVATLRLAHLRPLCA
jgi:hypothetical protein